MFELDPSVGSIPAFLATSVVGLILLAAARARISTGAIREKTLGRFMVIIFSVPALLSIGIPQATLTFRGIAAGVVLVGMANYILAFFRWSVRQR